MNQTAPAAGNFLRARIEDDLAAGTYASRRWAGRPGPAPAHAHAEPDPARIRTRFPPEPNGYLHIGHAKSVCLNFGLARDYGGRCHLRFDDTNPTREEQEYVDAIVEVVRWLGFEWADEREDNLYFASDYFEWMYAFAEYLIEAGHAYVDSQTPEQIRVNRGSLTEPGADSPFRNRPPAESRELFRRMRDGAFAEGEHVLRARIDMASPNINMRDPVLYRVRHAEHHRTGDRWCVYPMYDYAHPISDALENITHSVCTLEFEDHRPLYDWLLARLGEGGRLNMPLPQQIEFARLNLTYVITSKRRLLQLVQEGHVDGWDDPRMPTLVGLSRRGYTPESIRLFCDRIGVAKSDSWIEYPVLEQALRDDLEARAPRAIAVLSPLRLIIDDYPEGRSETCTAPVHPQRPELGTRTFPFSRELWIEADDFTEDPPKGYFRLYPGNRVRLRYGFVIECTGCDRDAAGNVVAVHARHFADSKSGTEGAAAYKVRGAIHWLSAAHALAAEVRLYDRLFVDPMPDAGGKDFLAALNPESERVLGAFVEPTLDALERGDRFQFESHGYFVFDGTVPTGIGRFNRSVTLRDSFSPRR
ncbi:MAG: glutamine--tRNA ligase/YqeY domain fusion protein [Burkholderiales bacterium]|nr:MAG: glutamine--tRNA ligase/YqeY domain fusion protein [Burkholderiales bacterium]